MDWNKHPFTDGHPSRFTNELGNRVPVHFWNISNANKSSMESFPKSIKWKVFRDKKGDKHGLEYISLASVEVKIAGKVLLPNGTNCRHQAPIRQSQR